MAVPQVMAGPYLEIRVCDARGNTISNEGGELSHKFEFDTLSDTIRAYNDTVELVNEEFEDEDDEPGEIEEVEEEEDEELVG